MTHKFFGIFRLDIKTYKSPSPSRLPNKKTLNILVRIRNRLCRPFKESSPYAVIYRGSVLYINVLKRHFTSPNGEGEKNEENL